MSVSNELMGASTKGQFSIITHTGKSWNIHLPQTQTGLYILYINITFNTVFIIMIMTCMGDIIFNIEWYSDHHFTLIVYI